VNLAPLLRQGLIEDWCDREITGGERWAGQIDDKLKKADIIILLVSPNFFESDYASGREMTEALRRHSTNQAAVCSGNPFSGCRVAEYAPGTIASAAAVR
jgi:hypothetical protein